MKPVILSIFLFFFPTVVFSMLSPLEEILQVMPTKIIREIVGSLELSEKIVFYLQALEELAVWPANFMEFEKLSLKEGISIIEYDLQIKLGLNLIDIAVIKNAHKKLGIYLQMYGPMAFRNEECKNSEELGKKALEYLQEELNALYDGFDSELERALFGIKKCNFIEKGAGQDQWKDMV